MKGDDFFQRLLDDLKQQINCVKFGVITSVNGRMATVKVSGMQLVEGNYINYPPIQNVPIGQLAHGNKIISAPSEIGDNVILLFSDGDISNFLRDSNLITPDTDRRHSFNDAIALPFDISFGGLFGPRPDEFYIGDKEGNNYISLSEDNDLNIRTDGDVTINCKNYTLTERGV